MTQPSPSGSDPRPARLGSPRVVRWGMGDALGGYLVAIVASNMAVAWLLVVDANAAASVLAVVVGSFGMWVGFIGAPIYATRAKGSNSLVRDFGTSQRWFDALIGLPLGVATQLVVLPVMYAPITWLFGDQDVSAEARDLLDRGDGVWLVALVVAVGIGAPIIEEVFFRGLFQRAAIARLGRSAGTVLVAVAFAATHLQPLQFPGLLAAGLLFGWLANRFHRLGPAIWAHIGFNLTTVAVLTTTST